ncbi:MAG: hypothetical protein H7A33_08355 [Deltaproteobacteria bacterium]|nr:hypothetical protein [Deltaproteobacteria bacterium]
MSFEKQANAIRTKIYKNMSPAAKLKQASQLYQTAWKLKRAGLKSQHPDWSDEQIETKVKEIFFYARS